MPRKLLSLAVACGLLVVLPATKAGAQVTVSSGVRISQIYPRGGELGSAFQNTLQRRLRPR